MQTALILGATGLVGQSCLQQLLLNEDYTSVISIGRAPLNVKHHKFQHHVVNFNDLAMHSSLFNVDHLYCCLGTTLKKAKSKHAFAAIDFDLVVEIATLAKQRKIKTFSVISSLGASPSSLSYYNATKGKMEQAIIGLGFEHTVIVRPCLLLGKREEFRPLEHYCAKAYPLIKPLFLGPLAKIKPIEVERVAKAMIHYANADNGNKLDIVENIDIHRC